MIGALFLSATLLAPLPDFPTAVRQFVEALEREDPSAFADRGTEFRVGFGEAVGAYDGIAVTSARVASVERAADPARLLVEIEGTALTAGTRRKVVFPRWWVLQLRRADGGWRLAWAVTLEQRLAVQLSLASTEDLQAALSREDIDPERFLILLVLNAADHSTAACNTLDWALATSRARGLWIIEAATLQMLSYVHLSSGNHAEAVRRGQESLNIGESHQDANVSADSLFSIGVAYWLMDRIDDAVASLNRAGSLATAVDDPRLPQRALYMAGLLELRRGRLREALVIAEDLQNLVARYPTARARLDAAAMLGSVHKAIGNHEIAGHQYMAALKATREIGDPPSEAIFLHSLASVARDRDASRDWLRQALAVAAKALGGGALATIELSYAVAQWEDVDLEGLEGTLATVIDHATEADERAVLAAAYALRADLRILQGKTDEAIRDARQARVFCEAPEGAGRAKIDKALSDVLAVEGRALRAAGQHDAAEAVWRAAIDVAEAEITNRVVDGTSDEDLVDRKFTAYRELIDLLVEQGCARDALIVAERMRARTLRDGLRHGRVDLSAGLDAAKRAREEELERALAAPNRALLHTTDPESIALRTRERDEARRALRRFRSELYLTNLELRQRRAETFGDYGTWEPAVAPGELVLAMAVTPTATFVFALRHGVQGPDILVRTIRLPRAELEQRVAGFVAALEHRNYAYRHEAMALHELLLGPVADLLADARTVRIVPDGVLWSLPFHALIDGKGRHVAERMSVSYSPSLVQYGSRNGHQTPRGTLFALADPRIGEATAGATRSMYRDAALGALPDAVAEVRSIARLYENAQVRIGAQANESAFKKDAGAFGVLHLATHSIVDDRAPMFSSIVLASSGSDPLEDGLLEAREIADLKLNADIAILSGCETARGKITPGEGIVGLSWAFLVAGVPRTVVSQWKVGSASTASLMASFHQRLRAGATPAGALREAMLDLRRQPQWRHPFYWAPFVVVEYGE